MQAVGSGPPVAGQPVASISRGHPRLLFATLNFGNMSQGLAFTAFLAALPQMAHDLGEHGELIAQMTMALTALGLLIGSLVSGWILEKAGTRTTLLASLVVYGAAGACGMVLRDPTLLLSARFAVGFASACLVTACLWGIAAEYSGDRRARALGIVNSMGSFMSLTGTVAGGLLASRAGWPATFGIYPVFALIGLTLGLVSVSQVKPGQMRSATRSEPFFLRLLPFFLLATLLFVVIFMASTQFAFLLQEDGVRDPAARSMIMSTVTVVGTLTGFGYGWLQQRLGVQRTFLLSLISATASLASLGFGNTTASAIVGAALFGVFAGIAPPYVYHVVAERSDSFTRSRAFGVLNAFNFLGAFLNPVILGPLARITGIHGVFLLAAVVTAALAAANFAGSLRPRVAI
jgi:MFS transporter, ACDE family, multidrug resistance protein